MNIEWRMARDLSYIGRDENNNIYRKPISQETCTVIMPDGRKGLGRTEDEALSMAENYFPDYLQN